MKKRTVSLLLAVSVAISAVICGCSAEIRVSETLYVFDTFLTLTLYGDNTEKLQSAVTEIRNITDSIQACASARDDESELSKLNSSAYLTDITVSEQLYDIIKTGLYYSELTDGAFDITLGYLTRDWAIGTENAKVPDKEFIDKYSGQRGWLSVITDDEKHTVRYTGDKISIDLGGIAKGYAAEKAREYLLSEGITKAMLDFGGNIVAIGRKNENSLWKIGIKNPLGEGTFAAISCENKAVVTSGNYERRSVIDGVSYHHILDGMTGYPADSGIISATIIADNSTVADCLSTAVFVLGAEKGLKLVEGIDGAEAIVINGELDVMSTSGINKDILEIL